MELLVRDDELVILWTGSSFIQGMSALTMPDIHSRQVLQFNKLTVQLLLF